MAQLLTEDQSDWSQLPEELLHHISKNLEDHCFDVIHARSVCSSWRSTFQFPSSLLRPSYSLPTLAEFTLESKDFCTLEKVPLFLFRVNSPFVADAVSPSEYFLGGISKDDNHMELPSPVQCSVKVKIPGSDPTLMNTLDCEIISLGHQYRMIGWDPDELSTNYRGVAFLPLNKDGEFVVLLNYSRVLLVLRSVDMKWMWLKDVSDAICKELVTFRGRFYAAFVNGDVFVIDPYSMEVIPLMLLQPLRSSNYLVPSRNDELFLVEKIISAFGLLSFSQSACRVSRLDEEARKWVVVSDLGDRVLFIGHLGNVCCSAKELPDGCGLSGNSILFTDEASSVTYAYKYEEHTGRAEDDLCFWRLSRFEIAAVYNLRKMIQSMSPDWTMLPEELLHLISENLDNCFDVVHARSVCRTWRSAFPFPSVLLRPRYSLPTFVNFPLVSKNLCYIEKIHLFLFRVRGPADIVSSIVTRPSEYFFLGGIRKDMSKNHKELPCPLQCSVKGKFPRYDQNVLDCQILPLGYQYRMTFWDRSAGWIKHDRGLAFLQLNKEGDGGEEYVVLLNLKKILLVLRSAEMKWMQVKLITDASCKEVVTFRGRFYAIFRNGDAFVINPYSLEATPLITLMPVMHLMYQYFLMPLGSQNYLVPSGSDELFLVEKFNPTSDDNRFKCRVSRLDEEAGKWVEVSELGDRVLFIGHTGNFCFSAKEFPDECGVTGNSILFSNEPGNETFAYKYGVHTGRAEDELNFWRYSRENRVTIRNLSPVVAFQVECQLC